MNELEEKLKELLIAKSAVILKCPVEDISWVDDLDEYGFSSMGVNQFCVDLNDFFNIDTQPVLFLEVTSLEALSHYLYKNYFSEVEEALLMV